MANKIPDPVKDIAKSGISEILQNYSRTKGKTKIGRWARFIANILPVDFLFDVVAHKVSK